jgi:hypothetical protein
MHPIDQLNLLLASANRGSDINIATLIEALLTIIDGLHNRICELEEAREPRCEMCDKPAPYGSAYCSSVCYYAAADQDPWSA